MYRTGFLAFVVFCSASNAQSPDQTVNKVFVRERDVETQTFYSDPRFEHGHLVGESTNHSAGPILIVADREGRPDEVLLTIEGASLIHVTDVAVSEEGEIAAVFSAYTSDNRAGAFLARIAADHSKQLVTRTWPYCPIVATFASDGTLWTIGFLKDEANTRVIQRYSLRHFDKAGIMLGSSEISLNDSHGPATTSLRSSRDRLGWLTRMGEYIKFSLQGHELARYPAPSGLGEHRASGLAMSDDGEVVIGRYIDHKIDFLTLDRKRKAWDRATLPAEDSNLWESVVGFDGSSLVTEYKNGVLRRFAPVQTK